MDDEEEEPSADEDAEPSADEWFGHSVAVRGDRVLVGNPQDSETDSRAGACAVFSREGDDWVHSRTLTASDAESGVLYGWDVGLDADRAVVSAMWHNGLADQAGAAYLYGGEESNGSAPGFGVLVGLAALGVATLSRDLRRDGNRALWRDEE